ncbi:SAM-dependent methyltransferase [Patescibacteria group bacterium]|nr:SAM-dependent methyltransferase [Patescibacteria group bacterium]
MFIYYLAVVLSLIAIVVSLVFTFFVLWSIITLFYTRVPWAPTPKDTIDRVINELGIKPGQKVYDLGCGDARVLIKADKTSAETIGYELSLSTYLRAKLRIWLSGAKTKIYRKNFLKVDLSDADIIFCFLVTKVMPKVAVKLKENLKHGTIVVSYAFDFPDWKPYKILDTKPSKTYFYQI